MNEIIPQEKRQEIEKRTHSLLKKVKTMEVKNEQQNSQMAIMLGDIKKGEKLVKEIMKPVKTAAKAAYDAARELERKFLAPIEEAKSIASQKVAKFVEEENRKREELQRKLDAEREERERKEAERVAKLKAKAEEKGKVSMAQERPIPQTIVPKVSTPTGTSYIEQWSAEVVNLWELCKGIVEGNVPANAVLPNMTVLNGLARLHKGELNIRGVRPKKTIVVRNR